MLVPPDVTQWIDTEVPYSQRDVLRTLIGNSTLVGEFIILLQTERALRDRIADVLNRTSAIEQLAPIQQIGRIVTEFIRLKLSGHIENILVDFTDSYPQHFKPILNAIPWEERKALSLEP